MGECEVGGWMDGRMHAWMHGCMDAWTDGRVDGWVWIDGVMGGWVDGWVSGWMDWSSSVGASIRLDMYTAFVYTHLLRFMYGTDSCLAALLSIIRALLSICNKKYVYMGL